MTRSDIYDRLNTLANKQSDLMRAIEDNMYEARKINTELEELCSIFDDSDFEFDKEEE